MSCAALLSNTMGGKTNLKTKEAPFSSTSTTLWRETMTSHDDRTLLPDLSASTVQRSCVSSHFSWCIKIFGGFCEEKWISLVNNTICCPIYMHPTMLTMKFTILRETSKAMAKCELWINFPYEAWKKSPKGQPECTGSPFGHGFPISSTNQW